MATLYQRYAPVVHGVLLARVGAGEAEDLTQEVFVSAMRGLAGLREPTAFGGWIVAAARNRAVSWLRERKARSRLQLSGGGVVEQKTSTSPEDGTRRWHGVTGEDVMNAIRELPEAYREALVLRLVEGLTGPQIAERVGMTHGSVRVNLHRGMEMLRAKLREVGR